MYQSTEKSVKDVNNSRLNMIKGNDFAETINVNMGVSDSLGSDELSCQFEFIPTKEYD